MPHSRERVYLCFADEDAAAAKLLADHLAEMEKDLLIEILQMDQYDTWTGRRIALESIRQSVGVIVCLSQAALSNVRIRREVRQAKDMGKKLYLVLLEKCNHLLAHYDETKDLATERMFDIQAGFAAAAEEIIRTLHEETTERGSGIYVDKRKARRVIADFLPRRSHNFVDRAHELVLIENVLIQRQSLLIQGLGGIGKTRLAVEVSHRIRNEFLGGVLWLAASDHPSVDSLFNALAIAFEFDLGGMQLDQKKLVVKRELSSIDFLLVIDDASTAQPILDLLDIATRATILCTSRPPLYVPGIQQFSLGVLAPPYATELFEVISAHKYMGQERATVDRICQLHLDGYPLAIELAANQLKVQGVPPSILAERIERKALDSLDVPYLGSIRSPLLATMEQLTNTEQNVFWSLGVFPGRTFTLQAVIYVNANIPDVSDHLFKLVSYSLVNYERERFSIHPLLKQFASENIREEQLFVRMVEYYTYYANHERQGDFQGIDEERLNMFGALDWSFNNRKFELFLGLIDSLLGSDAYYSYWAVNGYWEDATQKLEQAIVASIDIGDERRHSQYQLALGLFFYWLGKHASARNAYDAAEVLLTNDHDVRSLIRLYWQRGYIEDDEDNYALAKHFYQQSLDLAVGVEDKALIGTSRELVAVVAYHMGDYVRARELLESALEENRAGKDIAGVTRSQRRLAAVARMQATRAKSNEERIAYAEESRRLLTECLKSEKNQRSRARALRQIGMLDLMELNFTDARLHLESSLTLFERLGNRKGIAATLYNLGQLEEALGNLVDAQARYQESLEIGREINVKLGLALNLRQLGFLANKQGRIKESQDLLNQSLAILRSIKSTFLEETESSLEAIFGGAIS